MAFIGAPFDEEGKAEDIRDLGATGPGAEWEDAGAETPFATRKVVMVAPIGGAAWT
jgi:hypothetical protein